MKAEAMVKLVVHPNPFTSYISVQTNAGKYQLRIVDQDGKTMVSRLINATGAQQTKIETSSWPRGAYFVMLTGENASIIGLQKIIK